MQVVGKPFEDDHDHANLPCNGRDEPHDDREVDAHGSVDLDVARCDESLPGNLGVVGHQPR